MQYLESLRLLRQRNDWERTGSAADADRWDLRRMHSLLARLGDPHVGRGTVHVAGSKGKGSVASMIGAILTEAGVSTGLYTKPHLHRFVERVAHGGEPISHEDFGRLMGDVLTVIGVEDAEGAYGTVSTFEALVALAFLYFRERDADWQVLEVGLGGRLDATNVFTEKAVCVITPIGLEHTVVLGDTVAKIAEEKAAIITPGASVIMGPQRDSAADVIRRVCDEQGATLIEVAQACAIKRTGGNREGQDFMLQTPAATHKLRLPLLGRHQLHNAATAVLAIEALAENGVAIDGAKVRRGLAGLNWPGRVDIIRQRPLVVADGAHNRDSARALVQTMRDELGQSDVILVVGCSDDKDIDALAGELAPLATHVVATKSRHPRAMDSRDVATAFANRDVPATAIEPVGAALDAAQIQAGDGGCVVACGSLFVAAEAREHVLGVAYDPLLTAEHELNEQEVNI